LFGGLCVPEPSKRGTRRLFWQPDRRNHASYRALAAADRRQGRSLLRTMLRSGLTPAAVGPRRSPPRRPLCGFSATTPPKDTAPSATNRRQPGQAGSGDQRGRDYGGTLGLRAAAAIGGSIRALGAPALDGGGSAEPLPNWGQRPIARQRRCGPTGRAASAGVGRSYRGWVCRREAFRRRPLHALLTVAQTKPPAERPSSAASCTVYAQERPRKVFKSIEHASDSAHDCRVVSCARTAISLRLDAPKRSDHADAGKLPAVLHR
jgi:hypothetical protein